MKRRKRREKKGKLKRENSAKFAEIGNEKKRFSSQSERSKSLTLFWKSQCKWLQISTRIPGWWTGCGAWIRKAEKKAGGRDVASTFWLNSFPGVTPRGRRS